VVSLFSLSSAVSASIVSSPVVSSAFEFVTVFPELAPLSVWQAASKTATMQAANPAAIHLFFSFLFPIVPFLCKLSSDTKRLLEYNTVPKKKHFEKEKKLDLFAKKMLESPRSRKATIKLNSADDCRGEHSPRRWSVFLSFLKCNQFKKYNKRNGGCE
jgi:CBS domain containing-hemolysin-like protein